jgi:hypothetical protein
MPSLDRIIWNKLGIHRGDALPFTGAPWNLKSHRGHIVEIFNEAGFKFGAEIGIELGRFSRLLCDTIPELKLICVDPWQAYSRNSQEREDKYYQNAKDRLEGKNVEIMRMTSLEASQKVEDNSLDFVYIDALHDFDSVMMDLLLWNPKVKSGGIISGHDFVHYYQFGIIQAVQAFTQAHQIHAWYITTGEPTPSFLWIKP